MKKSTLSVLALTAMTIFACTTDSMSEEELSIDPNFNVKENILDQQGREEVEDFAGCLSVDLIAGQNQIAGSVSVETVNGELVLVYTANPGWTIEATHLSVGDCDEQSFPTTGSGNPKIGHFEHSSEHTEGVDQVTYSLNVDVLTEEFCFAAHAEVVSSEGIGETAWADGTDFSGNSWAMYVEALLTGCDSGGGGETGGGGDNPVVK